MEEILASIRKIIASDPVDKPAQQAAPANSDDGDVLELTDAIGDTSAGKSGTASSHEPETDITDDIIFETIEEPAMSSATPAASAARTDHDIFSDKTRQAMDNTFADLDKPQADLSPTRQTTHNAPAPKMPSGDSVQAVFERAIHTGFEPLLREHLHSNTDVIIERMKPLIREWMDEHFPALLEGAVRNEVARVVKARGR
jgi:uncharacterized protein